MPHAVNAALASSLRSFRSFQLKYAVSSEGLLSGAFGYGPILARAAAISLSRDSLTEAYSLRSLRSLA